MPVDPDPPLRRLGRCAGVDSLDSQSIDSTGATALDEVLLRLPVAGFQGVNANQNAGGYGATFVGLRNLNFNRTLVLIDGRRSVLSGIQTDEAVDLSTIPVELVDVNLTTLGRLTIGSQSTWLLNYRVQEAGTFPDLVSFGSLTRLKSLLDALGESSDEPFSHARGVLYQDLAVKMGVGAWIVRAGIDNATDRRPPTLIDGISNTNLNTYDVVGRHFYLKLKTTL